ncbi:MAG: hypothetical protein ABW023_04560 [Sphingomonas sp.]
MMIAACGLLMMAGSASAQDDRLIKMAKLTVQLTGHNYATYAKCHAPAGELNAFKDKSRAHFLKIGAQVNSGAEFDTLFASGQADGTAYWAKAVAGLGGEDKVRAAVCPDALRNLQISLTRK